MTKLRSMHGWVCDCCKSHTSILTDRIYLKKILIWVYCYRNQSSKSNTKNERPKEENGICHWHRSTVIHSNMRQRREKKSIRLELLQIEWNGFWKIHKACAYGNFVHEWQQNQWIKVTFFRSRSWEQSANNQTIKQKKVIVYRCERCQFRWKNLCKWHKIHRSHGCCYCCCFCWPPAHAQNWFIYLTHSC